MLNIILRGGRLTKYKGKTASFAPGLGISSPDIASSSISAPVLGRVASALGTSVSARALATRVLAVAFATAAPLAMTVTGANAGVCTETFFGSGIFVCTGPANAGTDVTQLGILPPVGGALDVSTLPGFGITTAAGDAINLRNRVGDTNITFTDNNASAITGFGSAIDARNNGTGAVSITTQAVTGTSGNGIYARNYTAASTSLTINAQGAVLGGANGVFVRNNGTGAVSITTQAVTGTNTRGIYAGNNNKNGTSLTINAQGAVLGGSTGLDARNKGTGALSITTQAVTGTTNAGIFAYNAGTSLTITAQGAVLGGATGAYAFGIIANNDGTGPTTITTSGTVTGNVGIRILTRTNNAPTTINTSATVTGTGGVAIDFRGDGNDTLNLFGGSIINGTIDFGNGNDGLGGTNLLDIDRLNVGPGVNAVLTFADASVGGTDNALQSAPENTSSNVALINGGTQAVAVDPTGFAAAGAALGSLVLSIFNSIDNNANGSPATAVPAGGTTGVIPAGGDRPYGAGRRLWVSGFGGKQKVEGSSNQAGIDNRFGGAITGVESGSGGSTYGVFGGYAVSNLDLEFGAGDVDVNSTFGGAYWKISTGTFNVNLAIVAGSADQDTTRNVGGVDARGESDGWFISPSLTIAVPMEFYAQPVVFSGRVSYAGLFLDGYTETGVANPLTVGDRNVHILNTRAQINAPYTMVGKDGSQSRLDLRAGVDAQFDAGSDKAALVVGGTPFSFSTQLDDEIAGFIGTTISFTSASGMFNFSASGEVQSTFDGGYQAVGEVRGAVNF